MYTKALPAFCAAWLFGATLSSFLLWRCLFALFCIVLINALLSHCVLQFQTYDILFDDKDTVKRQPRTAFTIMEDVSCEGDPNPPLKGQPMWIVGTKVRANFKGKGSWYNGVISAAYVSTEACRLGVRK